MLYNKLLQLRILIINFSEDNVLENEKQYRIYRQMVNSFYNEEQRELENKRESRIEEYAQLKPVVISEVYDSKLRVEFYIGNTQFYKIKSLSKFYDNMVKKEKVAYGKKFEFVHTRDAFDKSSLKLLDFIMKYAELLKYANENSTAYMKNINDEYIILTEKGIDDFFEIENGKSISYKYNGSALQLSFIDDEPKINFKIIENGEDEYAIKTDYDIYEYSVINGDKYTYFLDDNKLYRCNDTFKNNTLKILDTFRVNFTNKIPFKKDEFAEIYSLIIPKIKQNIKYENIDEKEIEKYIPRKLKVKLFLDTDKYNYVTCDLKFCYDNIEFNPLISNESRVPRNIVEESRALDDLKNVGFMYDENNAKLVLANENDIYNFLKDEINNFISKYEVLATNNFYNIQIVKPKTKAIGVKIENNLLNIDMTNIDFDKSEIEEIMKKYILKKRFHRLKNGTFIDLEENDTLNMIASIAENSGKKFEEIVTEKINMPIYRSFYLDKIIKKSNIVINQNKEYSDLIDNISDKNLTENFPLPKNLNASLREYQKVGYEWLKTLDVYGLGGILADDMGLGKTVQMLAVILDYVENTKEKFPCLVICPSSLALNWEEEAEKFTPTLKTLVINGDYMERKQKIEKIPEYDLAIISYDSLKRDAEIFEEQNYKFRYLIADEAQYIKNSKTQNAKAIKKLKSQTRFALTGTPIENSLAELWSIVDFIMPGYLYSYNKFKVQYETPIIKEENQEKLDKLKEIIEPFVLRRIKENVLQELPEKTITVLNNEMEGEQLKIYLSYAEMARKKAKEEIEENGIGNSQMKILSLLMRLRQICCHPGLFIENYTGDSKKLTQCIDIIKTGIEAGHRILLFSGYSSMFPYIQKELDELGIKYFLLTGQTKVSDRMDLVNEFNSNEDIKVFLISLKAGGTGLNLIGADVVIHYDPWWNLSVEKQATDRAYRIGQKKNIQVYNLITKNSIEEKIYELQQKKAKLADDILSTSQTFISSLSKEEIMNLFN